jgi:hypothetical protein
MDIEQFRRSLGDTAPASGLDHCVQALWWDAKGDWEKAHECAQADEVSRDGCWVHAYLHRKEGDLSNADGWYRRAGRARPDNSLDAEWADIAVELLRR